MKTLKPTLNEIYAPIENELNDFSALLKKELASDDALISDIHSHLLKMSGKFLRPALTILCAKAGPQYRSDALRLAAAIELIHTATLVHDDIIDGSDFRRNQPSVHSKWGREISIVSGDYLYAKAFLLLANLKDIWVNQAFAECAHVMCEGEMKQIEKRANFLMTEADYLKIIHKKTAALFGASARLWELLGNQDIFIQTAFENFGTHLGMAFQIVDDLLDMTGEETEIGKTLRTDILNGKMTLPLIYFRDRANPPSKIKALFNNLKNPEKKSAFHMNLGIRFPMSEMNHW